MYDDNEVIPVGTKFMVGMSAGMAGTDTHEAWIVVSEGTTRKDLDDMAWEAGLDWACSYGVYPAYELEEMSEEELEEIDEENYSDNIEGWWELWQDEFEGKCTYGNEPLKFRKY